MTTLTPAEEQFRWGVIKFDGKPVYEGEINRRVVAEFNAILPAVGLRIYSTVVDADQLEDLLLKQMVKDFAAMGIHPEHLHEKASSAKVPEKPALDLRIINNTVIDKANEVSTVREKPTLRIIKNETDT
jgi:hypothetical protein